MRNRSFLSIAAAGLVFTASQPARAQQPADARPAIPAVSPAPESPGEQASIITPATIVVPSTGVDSMQSLDFNGVGGPGTAAGEPVVEAIPTPSAFQGGLVVMGALICYRLIRKLRAA